MLLEDIRITAMSYGASGIGRAKDGKVVFARGACTGDVVCVQVTKEAASYYEGTVAQLVEPSLARVKPACRQVGTCGGCPWAHISYETQCEAKRNAVVEQLVRVGHIPRERADKLVGACQGSKHEWGYRNKLELAAQTSASGRFEVGFHEQAGNLSAMPKTCPIAAGEANKAPGALRGALGYIQGSNNLGIYRVGVRHSMRTHSTEVALWTPPSAFPRKAAANTISAALKCTSIVRVIANPGSARKVKKVEALYGKGFWEEQLFGNTYCLSAPSFFQINTAQAEVMIQLVLDGLHLTNTSVVADLYCGAGTFTLPLAQSAAVVYAVESAASSVRDLRRNIQHVSNISGEVEVIGGDSARELPLLGELDALVVDPPRAGLAKGVVESIANTQATHVAYVSCNPATLARDIARFAQAGYELKSATPVDLFPQTYHIETVAILHKR